MNKDLEEIQQTKNSMYVNTSEDELQYSQTSHQETEKNESEDPQLVQSDVLSFSKEGRI